MGDPLLFQPFGTRAFGNYSKANILAGAESPDDIRADCTGPQNSNRFDLHVSLSPFACSTFSISAGNRCISLGLLYHKGTLWFNYYSIA